MKNTTNSQNLNLNDVAKLASAEVRAYMQEGFDVSFTELSGAYGFVLKQVVLERGAERVVIWGEREDGTVKRYAYDIVISVSRFELAEGETMEGNYDWPSNWNEHLVKTIRAYNWNGMSWEDARYTLDEAEAVNRGEVHDARVEARHVSCFRQMKVTPALMKVVRRIKGFKTVKADRVTVTRCTDRDRAFYQIRKFDDFGTVTDMVEVMVCGKNDRVSRRRYM